MHKKQQASPLKNLRRARTLTQADLARLVGISQQSIAKAERGLLHLSPDVEARIAAVLGAARGEVFPDSEQVSA